MNFAHRHPRDSIVILEEGNQPHPRRPQCDMFVLHEALNRVHPTSEMCRSRTERKRQMMVVEEIKERNTIGL